MSDGSWSEQIAAERMQTDQEFTERVADSPLSSQQWSLVMTAIEFDIERPDDPDAAELVADTSRLSSVMSEIRRMDDRGASGMGTRPTETESDGGGLFDSLKDTLGIGSESDPLRETAERLAADYANRLQARLEERDRWGEICTQAQKS
ncbi:MAG: DUF5799 family protein [Halorhabdus sp.]